jgi:hypothetical protein
MTTGWKFENGVLNVWHTSILLLSGIYNPYEFEPPHPGGSEVTHKDAPQAVGLLWTSDQPVAQTSAWQHTQHSQRTNIRAPAGFKPESQQAIGYKHVP